MKKQFLLFAFTALMVVSIISCSKDKTTTQSNNANIQGKWSGTLTPAVGPRPYFATTFNSDGSLRVEQNNINTPDVATGTWTITGNTVKATYTFSGAITGTYSLIGTYTSSPDQINGTVGTGTSTSGYADFSVSK